MGYLVDFYIFVQSLKDIGNVINFLDLCLDAVLIVLKRICDLLLFRIAKQFNAYQKLLLLHKSLFVKFFYKEITNNRLPFVLFLSQFYRVFLKLL